MKEQFTKLIDLKSILTLFMTIILALGMFSDFQIDAELKAVFVSAYGGMIAHYFSRKSEDKK